MPTPRPQPDTQASVEVSAPRSGVLAVQASPLVSDALAVLDERLGRVQVGWEDGRRRYERRIELLARVLTPECFAMVLDWLSSTRRASVNTQRAYADDLRTVWAPLAAELGHERFWVGCLSAGDVRMWRLRQQRAGVSDRTIARRINALSSLHAYAAPRMDPPPRNPVTEDDRPRIDRHDSSTATPIVEADDIAKMAAAADGLLDVLVLHLLYTLAARVGELCAADLADRREEGRRSYLDLLRKGGKRRLMPLTPTTAELLDAHTAGRTDGPLLLDAQGRRLDRHDVDRITSRLGRRAGVLDGRDVTPHVLRASRITHLLDDGVPLADVQEFADHDDPATTLLYWRRRDKTARTARLADAADGLLSRAADRWLHPGGAPRL